jgi:hypothetical protein
LATLPHGNNYTIIGIVFECGLDCDVSLNVVDPDAFRWRTGAGRGHARQAGPAAKALG